MTPEQLERLPTVLFEIGKLVGQEVELEDLLTRVSQLICRATDSHACSVMLLDRSEGRLLTKAAYGLRQERMRSLAFAVGEGVAGWVAAEAQPALIADVRQDARYLELPDNRTPIVSLASVPILLRGTVVGVVTVTSDRAGLFDANTVEVMQFVASAISLDLENARLRKVAHTDRLTGAFNREYLAQRLPSEFEAAQAKGLPLSIAMVDVDHFKISINDRFGHAVGDDVLVAVAARLRSAIRNDDVLIRYGGEEFIVVLPSADAARAWDIGERMRARVAGQAIAGAPDSQTVRIEAKISVGVAQWRKGESAVDLMRRADTALYAAKAQGRNRVLLAPAPAPLLFHADQLV